RCRARPAASRVAAPAAPRRKGPGQSFDRNLGPRLGADRDRPPPALFPHNPHGPPLPLALAPPAMADERDQHVVPFLEDVGGHLHGRPLLSLGRVASTVDGRLNVLDNHHPPHVGGNRTGHRQSRPAAPRPDATPTPPPLLPS